MSNLTECWLWARATDKDDYGVLTIRINHQKRSMRAHRAIYEALKCNIPSDLQLDHLCGVRRCVNPDHLEPVTPKVNVLRSAGIASINARKNQCHKGHPFDAINTYITPKGFRDCRTCLRLAKRSHAQRKRELTRV